MNAERMIAGRPKRLELDSVLLVAALALVSLGLVMVASASVSIAESATGDALYYFKRQLAFAGIGVLVGGLLLGCPAEWWSKLSFLALAVAMVLLVVVLIPGVGHEVNGSTRWLRFGPVGVQVSEAARLLLLIYLCGYLVRHARSVRESLVGFLKPLALIGAACVLLLAEPDFGAAVVLVGVVFGVMFLAGTRLSHLLAVVAPSVAMLAAIAWLSPYRVARMKGFLDPWADPFDSGFQLVQSLIAIGRGEWFGVGLGASVQKLFYLPEAHTDFVFAVLAEELGLLGAVALIALFAVVVWRALAIGRRAAEAGLMFQAHLANGIGIWFGLQAAINMGVNMGLLPTKGLTLPLVSYGGSSLLVTTAAMALLLRVHHEAQRELGVRPVREVRA